VVCVRQSATVLPLGLYRAVLSTALRAQAPENLVCLSLSLCHTLCSRLLGVQALIVVCVQCAYLSQHSSVFGTPAATRAGVTHQLLEKMSFPEVELLLKVHFSLQHVLFRRNLIL
jgi:hypothetical protein